MKYPSKLFTIFLLGLFTGAGTFIYAASTWQDTSYIEDGQIIEAGTIKSNFDYLFERSWDVVGDVFTTTNKVALNASSTSADLTLDVEGKVGAREYCNQEGNECFTATEVESFPVPPACSENEKLTWDGTTWQCEDSGEAPCTTNYTYRASVGSYGINPDNPVRHMQVIYVTSSEGWARAQCIDGNWSLIDGQYDRGR